MGLQGLVLTTQTQTSDTDYNHLTLDPVTPGCSTAAFTPPHMRHILELGLQCTPSEKGLVSGCFGGGPSGLGGWWRHMVLPP